MPGPLSLQTSRNNFLSTRPKANNVASQSKIQILFSAVSVTFLKLFLPKKLIFPCFLWFNSCEECNAMNYTVFIPNVKRINKTRTDYELEK
jgi:hypothetical protein